MRKPLIANFGSFSAARWPVSPLALSWALFLENTAIGDCLINEFGLVATSFRELVSAAVLGQTQNIKSQQSTVLFLNSQLFSISHLQLHINLIYKHTAAGTQIT